MPKSTTLSQRIGASSSMSDRQNQKKRRKLFMDEETGLAYVISFLKRKIFTANHLMVQSFRLPWFVFLLVVAVEYLQLTYFSFFNLEVHVNQRTDRHQIVDKGVKESFEDVHAFNWQDKYNILKMFNYQTMIIDSEAPDALTTYYATVYLHLGLFTVLTLLVTLLGMKRVMRAEKFLEQTIIQNDSSGRGKLKGFGGQKQKHKDNFEDKDKKGQGSIKAQILAVVVFFAQTLLAIPTLYLASTIFNCEKLEAMSSNIKQEVAIEPTSQHVANQQTSSFQCMSRDHIIMMSIIAIFGVLTLLFLAIEALIFQDLNMKGKLPWRQTPNRLTVFKVLQKLICVLYNFSLFTDKGISYGAFVCLSAFIVFKRYQYFRIYDATYRRILLFTEISTFWFSLWNLTSDVFHFHIEIYSFTILILLGLIPFYLSILHFFEGGKFERLMVHEWHTFKELGSDLNVETFFSYFIELIKGSQKQKQKKMLLFGLLRAHWYQCRNEECLCNSLIQRIDQIEHLIEEEIASRNDAFDVSKLQAQIDKMEQDLNQKEQQRLQQMQLEQSSKHLDQLMFNIQREASLEDEGQGEDNPDALPTQNNNSINNGIGEPSSDLPLQTGTIVEGSNTLTDGHKNNPYGQTIESKKAAEAALKEKLKSKIEESQARMESNKHLKQQLKYHFFKFTYQLVEEAITVYPQSFRLKYLAAFIQYYLLKNEIKGLFEVLMLEKRNKVPLEWQFFLFKVKIEVEDYMDFMHKERSKQSGRIDVKKVYLFAKQLQDFERRIEEISILCIDFWKELLKKSDFDANNLHHTGNQVTISNREITTLVTHMFEINPHHGYLLRVYALFLQKVMNNEEDSEKYMTKFLNAQKTFQSYESPSLKEELVKNFSSNIKYAIIVMRVTTTEIGIVEDINHEVRTLLGYRRQEVINKKIEMLMPQCVGDLHDQFVQNYLDTAKPKILNKQREIFALKKNGYIQQIFIYVISVPMIEKEGIKFVGFLKKVDEKKFTELLPPPIEMQSQQSIQIIASPNGNIYGMNEASFKFLGLPKYFAEESDHKLSDINMSKLVKDFQSVLFECLRNSPAGQKAIITNDAFKNSIVPDRHSLHDLRHIRKCQGRYHAIIQAQPLDFGYQGGAYLPMIVYRIYIIERQEEDKLQTKVGQKVYKALKGASSYKQEKLVKPATLALQRYKSHIQSPGTTQKLGGSPYSNNAKSFIQDVSTQKISSAQSGAAHMSEIQEIEEDSIVRDAAQQDRQVFRPTPIIVEDNLEGDSDEEEQASPGRRTKRKQSDNKKSSKMQEIANYLDPSKSSGSGSIDNSSADVARLKEFIKMVNSKKEPQTVIFLRRMVYFITIVAFSIIIVNIVFKLRFYAGYQSQMQKEYRMKDIVIGLYHIDSDIRTLINIQNNITADEITNHIPKGQLQKILLMELGNNIQDLNDNNNALLYQDTFLLNNIPEVKQQIWLQNLQTDGSILEQLQSISLALSQVVSHANSLVAASINNTRAFQYKTLIDYINKINHNNYTYGKLGNTVDDVTKSLYFINTNVYKSLIDSCESIEIHLEDLVDSYVKEEWINFLIKLNIILVLITCSIIVIFPIARRIHKTRVSSLSLYAELKKSDVHKIIKGLYLFLTLIKDETEMIGISWAASKNDNNRQDDQDADNGACEEDSNQFDALLSHSSIQGSDEGDEEGENEESLSPSNVVIKMRQTSNLIISPMQATDERSQDRSSDEKDPASQEEDDENDDNIQDPNMSQRQLNQMEQIQRSGLKEQEIEEEKVGNLENFKMVKSNSGFKVFGMVLLLFAFIIGYVAVCFGVYLPMFQDMRDYHSQKNVVLDYYRAYYRIYLQMHRDLQSGTRERSIDSKYDDYEMYMDHKFELNKAVQGIDKKHSEFLEPAIVLLRSFNLGDYCLTLRDLNDEKVSSMWNLTMCEKIDDGIFPSLGEQKALERMTGEMQKLRLIFESNLKNYTAILQLYGQGQILSNFQVMMDKFFTPAYKIIRSQSEQSIEKTIDIYQKIDISLFVFFGIAQFLVLMIAWPRFLKNMNEQIWKSRGVLTLIPSRLIIQNNNIKKIIKQNKLLNQ